MPLYGVGNGANPGHTCMCRQPDPAPRNCSRSSRRSITAARRRAAWSTRPPWPGRSPTPCAGRLRPESTSSTTVRWASPPGSRTCTSGRQRAGGQGRWRATSRRSSRRAGTGRTSWRVPRGSWTCSITTHERSGSGWNWRQASPRRGGRGGRQRRKGPSGAVSWVCVGPMKPTTGPPSTATLVNFKVARLRPAARDIARDVHAGRHPRLRLLAGYNSLSTTRPTRNSSTRSPATCCPEGSTELIIESGAFLPGRRRRAHARGRHVTVPRPVLQGGLRRAWAQLRVEGAQSTRCADQAARGPHQVPRLLRELARAACLRPAAPRLD